MSEEFKDPMKINDTLTAIIPEDEGYRFIWTNYESGEIKHTLWEDIPEGFYERRPLARAFMNNYEIEAKDCGKVLTYGPAAGGLGEAGAFKIATCGEKIDSLVPYLGFKKREMLNKAIGKEPWEALPYIERITGQFSISYASLFYALVFGFDCPDYLLFAKELERVHNHIWVMHKLAGDASQKVANMHLAAITEEFLRLNLKTLGHRYGMNFLRAGPRKYEKFHQELSELKKWFLETAEELSDSRIFIDRLQTTCALKKLDILRNDVVGIPARASGVLRDARKIGIFKDLYGDYSPPMESYGDSLSRFLIRMGEVEKSFEILENIKLKECKVKRNAKNDGFYEGMAEAPPGDIYMGVKIEKGRVKEIIIRPPSLVMYHAFSVGIRGNVFTDFPFALDSFGAYFSDADIFGRWA
ncbi:Respiratory-chain NADH dehydrogenase, 49 Kd subunit domain protein [Aciduliprofundum boonei T469]|nr:Respiratory-chain NADH dehydrogenase, 49 Kd subunit domain protein [Aciduliprofundum boonei T469]